MVRSSHAGQMATHMTFVLMLHCLPGIENADASIGVDVVAVIAFDVDTGVDRDVALVAFALVWLYVTYMCFLTESA